VLIAASFFISRHRLTLNWLCVPPEGLPRCRMARRASAAQMLLSTYWRTPQSRPGEFLVTLPT